MVTWDLPIIEHHSIGIKLACRMIKKNYFVHQPMICRPIGLQMTQLERFFKLLDKSMMKAAPGLVETCLSTLWSSQIRMKVTQWDEFTTIPSKMTISWTNCLMTMVSFSTVSAISAICFNHRQRCDNVDSRGEPIYLLDGQDATRKMHNSKHCNSTRVRRYQHESLVSRLLRTDPSTKPRAGLRGLFKNTKKTRLKNASRDIFFIVFF